MMMMIMTLTNIIMKTHQTEMHIEEVANVLHAGSFGIREGRKLKFDACIDIDLLKDKRGRVYLITHNGIIKKIGGSQDKGGLKGTMEGYCRGLVGKSESARSYGVAKYIHDALTAGDTIDIYCVWAEMRTETIPSMFGQVTVDIPLDFHTIESQFVQDYRTATGSGPYLNMQENGTKWADTGLLQGYKTKQSGT